MSLDDKFLPVQIAFYEVVSNFFKTIAKVFGYPKNPGMSTGEDLSNLKFLNSLPIHQTSWPPRQTPANWWQVFLGTTPKVDIIPRYSYETQEEGFYNFYIENYKNMYFLPDWFSEFLQVNLNFCLDLMLLENLRQSIFLAIFIYSQIVILRIALSWFIVINPYSVPWCYIAAAVDWTEEILQGIVPSVLGVNLTGTIFLGVLGAVADSLNHLVLTMPYLPSEGQVSKLLINNQMKDVLVFHYIPILWYKYPIPNEIRKFWAMQRRDILEYFQKYYYDFDIQFVPDITLSFTERAVYQINKQIQRMFDAGRTREEINRMFNGKSDGRFDPIEGPSDGVPLNKQVPDYIISNSEGPLDLGDSLTNQYNDFILTNFIANEKPSWDGFGPIIKFLLFHDCSLIHDFISKYSN